MNSALGEPDGEEDVDFEKPRADEALSTIISMVESLHQAAVQNPVYGAHTEIFSQVLGYLDKAQAEDPVKFHQQLCYLVAKLYLPCIMLQAFPPHVAISLLPVERECAPSRRNAAAILLQQIHRIYPSACDQLQNSYLAESGFQIAEIDALAANAEIRH